MTDISVEKDAESLTMTIIAQSDAPTTRVWQVWQDPRQLERWWGPPTYPATVVCHDLTPGGSVTYFMTGPEGDTHHGWWVSAVEAPRYLEFIDGSDQRPSDDRERVAKRRSPTYSLPSRSAFPHSSTQLYRCSEGVTGFQRVGVRAEGVVGVARTRARRGATACRTSCRDGPCPCRA